MSKGELLTELSGGLDASGLRIAIVVSRFNQTITEQLLEGALESLRRCGIDEERILVARVPGSFEIPLAAQKIAERGDIDAIVCLGAVIRGETPHFDYICASATSGVEQVALRTGIPLSNGILTTENVEQALNRSGLKYGNKGAEAAQGAVEMANLLRRLADDAATS